MKPLFKTEVTKIRNITFGLKMHQKLNGTQVILGDQNKAIINRVNALLSEAANLLETVK